MISQEEAQAIVERRLAGMGPLADGDALALLPQHTQEHEFGWVFFYNSRRFLETGDFGSRLAGNGPMLVDRRTGELEVLPTHRSVEQHLAARESRPRRIVITGWRPGFRELSHTELLRARAGLPLLQAHEATCKVLAGETVTLHAVAGAQALLQELTELGAVAQLGD